MKGVSMNKEETVKTTYDSIAQKYSEIYFEKDVDLFKDILKEFLSNMPMHATILDAGCGTGNFAAYFLGKGCRVTAVDASDGMLAVAKRNVPAGDFRKMDIMSLDFPDGHFDAAFLKSVLVNIEKKKVTKVLAEIRRVLKKNGLILISQYIGSGEHVVEEPLKQGLKMLFNFYSEREAEDAIKSSGFDIIKSVDFDYPEDLGKYYGGKFIVFFARKR